MAAIVVVTYAAIVATMRRGFDWTDEAFSYTLIASNRIATDVPLGFQHVLHPLYVLTGQNVLAFRFIRLVGYVLLSIVLLWCARVVMRRAGISLPRSGWAFVLLLAQVGTFLAWSYPPRFLGYNELSSWLAQLGIALILVALSWRLPARGDQATPHARGATWLLWLIWAGLGAITVLLLFAKVTSALAFGMVLAVAVLIPNPGLSLWKRLLSLAAGTTAELLVLTVSGAPILAYVRNAFTLLFDNSAQASFGHPVSTILGTYWSSLVSTGRAVLPVLILFALAMATYSLRGVPRAGATRAGAQGGDTHRGAWIDGITWVLGALVVIALFALPRVSVWSYLAGVNGFIGAAGIIGLTMLATDHVSRQGSTVRRSMSVAFAGLAVVAAPFISAAGTNNALAQELAFSGTLWAVVLGIALVLLTQRATLHRSSAHSLPAIIGAVVVLLAAVAVKADIAKPYRNPSLLSQGTSTSVPELRGLLLAEADAARLDWISAAGQSLHADGIPATATGSPGEVFAFNRSGYASPWVGSRMASPYASLTSACKEDPPVDLFVLQSGSAAHTFAIDRTTASLARCGVSFPADFTVVARRDSADPKRAMTIWRRRAAGASS